MSLFRQLWLTVIAGTILAFGGSFVLSMLTARNYLEQQLYVKNVDNANALALSLSQGGKDAVERELLIAAQFDTGHYQLIRLSNTKGTTLVERTGTAATEGAPAWFASLVRLHAAPGSAQVSDGWRQIGKLTVISQSRYAYLALWQGALELAFWFVFAGALAGLLGALTLRRIKRPLDAVVEQAQAITQRRFTMISVPSTPELKSLAGAMNNMVQRLKSMFDDEAARLEEVRREANHDPLTGLANRAYFLNRLEQALLSDDAAPEGLVLVMRVADLTELNRSLGRSETDELLKRAARVVASPADLHSDAFAGRLNGADFALLVPSRAQAGSLAAALIAGMRDASTGLTSQAAIAANIGVCRYRGGMTLNAVLARMDAALAGAEAQGPDSWLEAADPSTLIIPQGNADWERSIRTAIASQRLKLVEFPVADTRGKLLHQECLARLQMDDTGDWLPATHFIPMARRLKLTAELDIAVLTLALERATAETEVAVNLAAESLGDPAFIAQVRELLARNPRLAERIWFEVPESGALQHFDEFRTWCETMGKAKCRIGLEHVGHRFGDIGRMHGLGIDYLKVDSSFVRGIEQSAGNQAFLKGLCGIAHAIGMKVIGEGVASKNELSALTNLGFDGATGPAITRASQ